MDKNNYVIHYINLQQCLELGIKLKKIHRVLKRKQKDWRKPYIDFNNQKRKEATNEADENHSKLLNNAIYGKTMENMRKWIKIKVVKNAKDFIRYTSRPTCVNWKVFENNLAAIPEKKTLLTLNKLIYLGFTILDIWSENLTLDCYLQTQTVCLYELYGKNPYKEIYKYKELFDLSNFPISSKYYCSDNKKY